MVDSEGQRVSAQGSSPDDLPLEELGERWLSRPDSEDLFEALVHRVALRAVEGETALLLALLRSSEL